MQFNGVGPRVGGDLSYGLNNWWGGLSVYGKGATALLAGNNKFSRYGAFLINGPYISGSHFSIVPEAELKLGAKFDYKTAYGNAAFDIGYLSQYYWTPFTYNDGSESNFGINGLYFGLKFVGNL